MSRKERELARLERQGGEVPVEEDTGRPIRSEHRGAMMELKDLANRLAKLPRGQRRALPLDEEAQAQLDLLAGADGTAERRRLLMRAKLLLGASDLVALHAALEGEGSVASWDKESDRWRARIIAGDDAVLQAFVEAFPRADRQALRTSARDARGEGPAAARAQARLLQLIRDAGT